ncbi:dehydration-responsive element-binding protein 1I [Panicum miliaceum]|uniref:Dehydration-responsive element-binding protein 1I n=1 Tax=Panicum miliaceum TaxID=4540 RepID=A0A3L6RJI1_PANMI|nr:dehydration-responsive element-binding protein 1I [Panicum miliaceum]
MLALRWACGARGLNFADSAWLLDVPPPAALRCAEGGALRRAEARAVEGFLRTRPAAEDAMSATSEPPHSADHDDAATAEASSAKSNDGTASPFEMDDVLGDMGAGLYYASMAQGLLMDPPASDDASCCVMDPKRTVTTLPCRSGPTDENVPKSKTLVLYRTFSCFRILFNQLESSLPNTLN